AHADASLAALAESGIRARFSYGWPTGDGGPAGVDIDDLARRAEHWSGYDADGRLTLGLAWRGPSGGVSDVGLRELRIARELGLPITVHANVSAASVGGIAALARANLLGPDLQIVHAIACTPPEIEALAASGASVSVSPF